MKDKKLAKAAISLGLVRRKKKQKQIGLPPGSLIHTGIHDSTPIKIQAFEIIEHEAKELKDITIEQIKSFKNTKKLIWLKIVGVHDANLIHNLGEIFEIQPLALEDVMNTHQRTKYESYPGFDFIIQNIPYKDDQSDAFTTEQVSIITFNYPLVISFQERDTHVFTPLVNRVLDHSKRILTLGKEYLTYAILDILIDSLFPILDHLYDELEKLEEDILIDQNQVTLTKIHRLRQNLFLCRKCIWPSRDMLNVIFKENNFILNESVKLYYRDVFDHTNQLIDTIENYRDLSLSLVDSYMNQTSLKMNEVMKILTIISTIFIPLSFIAGVYGMNFNPEVSSLNMPELNWVFGYPFALTLMGSIALSLLFFFRRKRWI
ncbi:magnesium/cobalt transporter CorA [Limnoraphis robusta]|uniref:Magnesium transport protein CorA n=1 Tax=Limnoraphis robusta CCNP1315 TaxID=3110306 RepID=A0ABU5U0Y9_9CYAN|nr:magnesium/cobalt transporter CorA [Limnoraphis robusta]MEA5520835.1 magnesium/cobalt transporter CorA [Limnoraphis robusta CCNP1315]